MPTITDRAKDIIDAVQVPYPGPLCAADYINALPPEAELLKGVLRERDIADLAKEFLEKDKRAVLAQRKYIWPRRIGLWAVYGSVILAGLSVYASGLNKLPLINAIQPFLLPAQLVFLLIMLGCTAIMIYWWTARRVWLAARSDAEIYRLQFYKRLTTSPGKDANGEPVVGEQAAWLAALQLECFRKHVLEEQSRFFKKRIDEHRGEARLKVALGFLALALIAAASVPQMAASVTALFDGFLPDGLHKFVNRMIEDRKLYALSWLYGASLQLVIARLAFISPVASHIATYKVVGAVLEEHERRLNDARKAAATGVLDSARWFAGGVLDTLEAERRVWEEQRVFGGWK